ncbi:MAG: ABC transporter permease [Halobacteriaceae archaeon]
MHPLIGRLEQALITIFAALTIGFVLIHQLPSGPLQILFALYGRKKVMKMDPDRIAKLSRRVVGFSADQPLVDQYIDYWGQIMQLNFGRSVVYQEPIFKVLAPAIPWTMFMSLLAMLFNTTIAISVGAYMAYREGSKFDIFSTVLTIVLSAIPYYILAIFFLFFLGYQTHLFPTGGRFGDNVTVGFNLPFMISALYHVALPFISMTFTGFAALGLRAHCIRILGSDYIRVARLRGLSERRIVFHYLLRNSLLPGYTGFVTGIGALFGGSVITEFIFNYKGMGWAMFTGAVGGDIPMVLGTFAFFTFASVLSLFIVDLTYHVMDPRAEGVGTDEAY